LCDVPRYRGIGTRLFAGATNYSVELGFDGRIGLVSLPQAEDFYLKRGFEIVREDAKEKMYYYEWTARVAHNFLNEGNR